MKLLAD